MYIAIFIVAVFNSQVALAQIHTSTMYKQVQSVRNVSSPALMIACAYRLKEAHFVGFRIAEGSDECEYLNMYQMTTAGYSPGFEYFSRETSVDVIASWPKWKEFVTHNFFSEVMLGDQFRFDIEMLQNDIFTITFQGNGGLLDLLIFDANSTSLTLNDQLDNIYGTEVKPEYPFTFFKQYKIVFEVTSSYWQIYIDDIAFATFPHRHPYIKMHKAVVKIGPGINYMF